MLFSDYLPSAVFLDRDGTINKEINYLGDPDLLILIDGAGEAIARLNQLQIPVIVITNQAGIARGFFTEKNVELVHQHLQKLLQPFKARIDHFYYCPHHPTAGIGKYRQNCSCRKPNPGMLEIASKDLSLPLINCVLIGDKDSDILAGKKVNCKTILVKTGYGESHINHWKHLEQPDLVCSSLLEAVTSLTEPSKHK
jgi:D-glycero-D-manno-heptose 1,7-bisphosphate phosphatase